VRRAPLPASTARTASLASSVSFPAPWPIFAAPIFAMIPTQATSAAILTPRTASLGMFVLLPSEPAHRTCAFGTCQRPHRPQLSGRASDPSLRMTSISAAPSATSASRCASAAAAHSDR